MDQISEETFLSVLKQKNTEIHVTAAVTNPWIRFELNWTSDLESTVSNNILARLEFARQRMDDLKEF